MDIQLAHVVCLVAVLAWWRNRRFGSLRICMCEKPAGAELLHTIRSSTFVGRPCSPGRLVALSRVADAPSAYEFALGAAQDGSSSADCSALCSGCLERASNKVYTARVPAWSEPRDLDPFSARHRISAGKRGPVSASHAFRAHVMFMCRKCTSACRSGRLISSCPTQCRLQSRSQSPLRKARRLSLHWHGHGHACPPMTAVEARAARTFLLHRPLPVSSTSPPRRRKKVGAIAETDHGGQPLVPRAAERGSGGTTNLRGDRGVLLRPPFLRASSGGSAYACLSGPVFSVGPAHCIPTASASGSPAPSPTIIYAVHLCHARALQALLCRAGCRRSRPRASAALDLEERHADEYDRIPLVRACMTKRRGDGVRCSD